MKILEKNELNKNWSLILYCRDTGWNDEILACNSKLEINKNDIRYRYLCDSTGRKIKIYGIVCPVCKTFVEIDKNKIPLVILNQAARMLEIKN